MNFVDLLREVKSNVITRRIVAGSLLAAFVLDGVVVYILFHDFLMHFNKFTEGILGKTAWVIIVYLLRLMIFSVCYSALLLHECSGLSFRRVIIFCRHFLSKIALFVLLFAFIVGALFFLTIDIGVVFDPICVVVFNVVLVVKVMGLSSESVLSWCANNLKWSILWLGYLLAGVFGLWPYVIFDIVVPQGFISYNLFYYVMSNAITMYIDILTIIVCCIFAVSKARNGHCSRLNLLFSEEGNV